MNMEMEMQNTTTFGDIWEKTLYMTELKYPIASTVEDEEPNEKEEDSSEESDMEIEVETEIGSTDDPMQLRPHYFHAPVSGLDSTAVKKLRTWV